MTLINCIEKVVQGRYLKYVISEGPQIVELKDNQSNMKITIVGVPASFLAIKMEGQWSQLKKRKKRAKEAKEAKEAEKADWNRICDYLLIYQEEDKHHAMFIELKKSLSKNKKKLGKRQLRRSLPVLDYLCSVCKIESGVEEKILSVKYVLIAENEKSSDSLDKQSVRVTPSEPTEERYEEILIRILIGTEFALNTLTG